MRSLSLLLIGLLGLTGCASIDIEPAGEVWRTVNGLVYFNASGRLPADSVLTVRVVDTTNPAIGPVIVGEQSIEDPGESPIAYSVEFRANDSLLRRGLNLEARISVDGRLRYSNTNSQSVNATNIESRREIRLDQIGG